MTETHTISNQQARQLLVHRHGLLGKKRYRGKAGIFNYISEIGSLQYDPINVCGRSTDITLHSRVDNYRKKDLQDLLYKERTVIDYFDKNLGIYPLTDFPKFHHHKQWFREHAQPLPDLSSIRQQVVNKIREKKAVTTSDFDLNQKVQWEWGQNKLSRAALEYLYQSGELLIHHKEQNRKFYTLPELVLANSDLVEDRNDFETEQAFFTWLVKRRLSNVGLLWNRASDTWLGMPGFKANHRQASFTELLANEQLIQLDVTGISEPLYMVKKDKHYLEDVLNQKRLTKRVEFIAPLDALIWERKLITQLFHFDYKWEIYTPASQRQYGHYVLPILYGSELIGRIELKNKRDLAHLVLDNYWLEPITILTAPLQTKLNKTIEQFARLNDCHTWDKLEEVN